MLFLPTPWRFAAPRSTLLQRAWWLPLGLALVASVAGCERSDGSQNKPPVPLVFTAAEVTQPQRGPMAQRIEFSGPLVAPRTATARAKAAGTLLTLDVGEGSRVRAGQALGRIDLAELQLRITDRDGAVEAARATLAEAERQHQANMNLSDQQFISATALESSRAKLNAARAQLKSAEAQLGSSHVGVREAALVAPIAGIVGKRYVLPGEKLAAEQNLLTIVDLRTLELAGTVGAHEVSQLAVGQPVQVSVEGSGAVRTGRIDRIAPAADAGTRAIGVVVVIDNPDERLRAGQYAQASVTLADDTPRLSVPRAAVTQNSGQDQVWTIEHGALVRRIVITGRSDAATGRVELLRGLAENATVLAERFDGLKEGAPARVEAAGSATPASGAAASGPGRISERSPERSPQRSAERA